MGRDISGQVGIGYIRKLAQLESESKPVSSVPLRFLLQVPGLSPCPDFLLVMDCDLYT